MIVGIPKEIKDQEHRVALLPAGAYQLTQNYQVLVEEGVIHYCVANMPGAYARTATQVLTNATFPYIQTIADFGLKEACDRRTKLASGINVHAGHVVNRTIAETHGLAFAPFNSN